MAAHQPGIATRQQAHLGFAAFDLEPEGDLRGLLVRWTQAAARLAGGRRTAGPLDSGEANELHAAGLTVTFGLGPSLFERAGLADRRPVALRRLPAFAGDALDPDRCDGDLCAQVCADDPQVVFHAVRTLTRAASGARLRWAQTGFIQRGTVRGRGPTPRGLIGFREGANNLRGDGLLDRHVWIDRGDRSWMRGGTYLVARRIRLELAAWDELTVVEQERAVGREKVSGAEIRPKAPGAHVAVVREEPTRLLRRGYNYFDGELPGTGELDAGLMLICFARDPRRQFVPLQRRLARSDALAPYGVHTGSAVFAIPPAASPGGFVGDGLLR